MTGLKVYLDYDQEELDRAYHQPAHAPNVAQIMARLAAQSADARRYLGEPKRFAYGPSEIEGCDVYLTRTPSAPVVVFVHGGAWRGGLALDHAHAAQMFVGADANFVVLDFINVIEAGGSLFPMVEQVRRAFAWLYRNAESFGGDPESIHLVAHSSGSHLGGCVMVTDWQRNYGLPSNIVKSGTLASGMYDLYPVSLSARSSYVNFTPEMIDALSSKDHIEERLTPRCSSPTAHWRHPSSNGKHGTLQPQCIWRAIPLN
jgi:arylformamidase